MAAWGKTQVFPCHPDHYSLFEKTLFFATRDPICAFQRTPQRANAAAGLQTRQLTSNILSQILAALLSAPRSCREGVAGSPWQPACWGHHARSPGQRCLRWDAGMLRSLSPRSPRQVRGSHVPWLVVQHPLRDTQRALTHPGSQPRTPLTGTCILESPSLHVF